jgi:hypothetical protein
LTKSSLSAFEKDWGEAGEGALSCHYFVEFPPKAAVTGNACNALFAAVFKGLVQQEKCWRRWE